MLSLWANWLVTKFGLNSLKRYLWPVLYMYLNNNDAFLILEQVNIPQFAQCPSLHFALLSHIFHERVGFWKKESKIHWFLVLKSVNFIMIMLGKHGLSTVYMNSSCFYSLLPLFLYEAFKLIENSDLDFSFCLKSWLSALETSSNCVPLTDVHGADVAD